MNVGRDNRFPTRHPAELDPNQVRPVSPEELAEFRKCFQTGFLKAGVPFAVALHVLNSFLKKTKLQFTPSHIPLFLFNTVIGGFFYAPSCYKRLQTLYFSNQQKILQEKEQMGGLDTRSEGSAIQSDDINYQSKFEPGSFGPEGNFSHLHLDVGSSYSDKPILDDIQGDKSQQLQFPTTTYEDLRRQNRETYRSSSNFSSPRTEMQSPIAAKQYSEPPPKKVIRNKYGDEMES